MQLIVFKMKIKLFKNKSFRKGIGKFKIKFKGNNKNNIRTIPKEKDYMYNYIYIDFI